MSLPATDNFNRADGGVGSNWTALQNSVGNTFGHEVFSNQCRGAGSGYCFSAWTADTFDANQYAQIAMASSAAYIAPFVRAPSSGSADGYLWTLNNGADSRIYRIDDGVFTQLQNGISIPALNSVCKITADGSTLKAYDDGSQVGTSSTDGTYASGSAGMMTLRDTPIAYLDDWEGGNLGPPPAVFPLSRRALHHSRRDVFRHRSV